MSYDPEARRETPLTAILRARIKAQGPISVAEYVDLCLNHPEHGYYRTRAAIGRQGDFITAPEISQTFGELIGLWSAAVWQSMGSPARVLLIELGPGRGTLMADALRAARVLPPFLKAADVVLVEVNPVLRDEQQRTLTGQSVRWVEKLTAELLDAPAIVIGNEFLDVLPIEQSIVVGSQRMTRTVDLDPAGRLVFGPVLAAGAPMTDPAPDGTIFEHTTGPADLALWSSAPHPLATVFIDYGHSASAPGDTLQAVRNHAFEHPLTAPGEADLSFQVDFAALTNRAQGLGLAVDGPTTQAEFLGRLGIIERAQRLVAANPAKGHAVEMGVARLLQPQGMGGRFKAIGIRSPAVPPLPGF
jgi:SAM-dependent MidA family methyltransferase